jgi:DNA-binding PadR family transcriptional regulator
MSTIDLMLLGVLSRKSINAYEMKKEMENRQIKYWVKISGTSVYKNLVKLHKQGYLDGKMVREGEMPEKTIYTINAKGREYFMQLMEKYSKEPGVLYVDFSAFIANLSYVDYETGLKMIEDLQSSLAQKQECIKKKFELEDEQCFYGISTMEIHLQACNTFCNWAEEFKKKYIEHHKKN